MTQEEYDKAPEIDKILYDKTGMLAKNHTGIIEAMTEYAESEVKKLGLFSVSQQRELLISFFNWYQDDQKELSNNETIIDAYLEEINCW